LIPVSLLPLPQSTPPVFQYIECSIAIGCVAATPVVITASADETAVADAVKSADLDPPSDVHASADYRRHLAAVLAARAIRDSA